MEQIELMKIWKDASYLIDSETDEVFPISMMSNGIKLFDNLNDEYIFITWEELSQSLTEVKDFVCDNIATDNKWYCDIINERFNIKQFYLCKKIYPGYHTIFCYDIEFIDDNNVKHYVDSITLLVADNSSDSEESYKDALARIYYYNACSNLKYIR